MIHPLLVLAEEQYLHTDALARALKPATVAKPKHQAKPYKLADGGGLFLLVLPKGNDGQRSRLWRYKYRVDGKEGLYALGAYPEISLADARKMHRAARWLVERGKHPLQYVEEAKQYQAQQAARKAANTFRVVCESWLSRDKKSSPRTIAQRRRELEKDVFPRMGDKAIADIRKEELKELLEAVQERAPEVARNIRNYLTGIFDYAMDAHLVTGSPVPGPKVLNTRDQVPHPALPVARAGEFLRALDAASCTEQVRIAMRLLVLTVVRKSELIEARWDEFDLEKGEWNIPAPG